MPTPSELKFQQYRDQFLAHERDPGSNRMPVIPTGSADRAIYERALLDAAERLVLANPADQRVYAQYFGTVDRNTGDIVVPSGPNSFAPVGRGHTPVLDRNGDGTLTAQLPNDEASRRAVGAAMAISRTVQRLRQGVDVRPQDTHIRARDYFSPDGEVPREVANVVNNINQYRGRTNQLATLSERSAETVTRQTADPLILAEEFVASGTLEGRRPAVHNILTGRANGFPAQGSNESDRQFQFRIYERAEQLSRAGDNSAQDFRIAYAVMERKATILDDREHNRTPGPIGNQANYVRDQYSREGERPDPQRAAAAPATRAPATPAPATPAPAAPTGGATTDISESRGTAMQIARSEIMPRWSHRNQPAYVARVDAILADLPAGSIGEQSSNLWRAAEAARTATPPNDLEYRANRAAITLIRRAEVIEHGRARDETTIPAIADNQIVTLFNRTYARAGEIAGGRVSENREYENRAGYAPAATDRTAPTPGAGGAGGAGGTGGDPETPATPTTPQPRSRTAEARESADAALTDDALLAYARGETAVRGTDGTEQRHGNLFRGAQNINPDQFDPMIKDLQQSLDRVNENGLQYGADGVYGGATAGAVRALQTKYGLRADGIAGRMTVTALQVEEASVLINRLKEGGLTDAEKAEIQKELADVQTMIAGQTNIPAGVLQQLTGALDGLKAATGGNDVTGSDPLATTVAALRAATTPGRES